MKSCVAFTSINKFSLFSWTEGKNASLDCKGCRVTAHPYSVQCSKCTGHCLNIVFGRKLDFRCNSFTCCMLAEYLASWLLLPLMPKSDVYFIGWETKSHEKCWECCNDVKRKRRRKKMCVNYNQYCPNYQYHNNKICRSDIKCCKKDLEVHTK